MINEIGLSKYLAESAKPTTIAPRPKSFSPAPKPSAPMTSTSKEPVMTKPAKPKSGEPKKMATTTDKGPGSRSESIQENIKYFRKIVDTRTAGKIPGMGAVDLFTASAVTSVHDSLSPENQKKYVAMSPHQMVAIAHKIMVKDRSNWKVKYGGKNENCDVDFFLEAAVLDS